MFGQLFPAGFPGRALHQQKMSFGSYYFIISPQIQGDILSVKPVANGEPLFSPTWFAGISNTTTAAVMEFRENPSISFECGCKKEPKKVDQHINFPTPQYNPQQAKGELIIQTWRGVSFDCVLMVGKTRWRWKNSNTSQKKREAKRKWQRRRRNRWRQTPNQPTTCNSWIRPRFFLRARKTGTKSRLS